MRSSFARQTSNYLTEGFTRDFSADMTFLEALKKLRCARLFAIVVFRCVFPLLWRCFCSYRILYLVFSFQIMVPFLRWNAAGSDCQVDFTSLSQPFPSHVSAYTCFWWQVQDRSVWICCPGVNRFSLKVSKVKLVLQSSAMEMRWVLHDGPLHLRSGGPVRDFISSIANPEIVWVVYFSYEGIWNYTANTGINMPWVRWLWYCASVCLEKRRILCQQSRLLAAYQK